MNAITPVSTSNLLASRALVVSLSISQWSGRRLDRSVTDEVNRDHGAADDAGRYNKLLLPKDALEPIAKVVNATRTDFLQRTLPWLNDGSRIMKADAFLDHSAWFRRQKDAFQREVRDFLQEYPGYLQSASARLGTMFDLADYPSVDEIERKFGMDMKVLNTPSADDFRVRMSDAQAESIRAQIEETVTAATKAAVRDVYLRIQDVTKRVVERLSAYKPGGKGQKAEGVFRDSLIENVRDLVGVMPNLNITGDPELDRLANDLRTLARFDADVLRASDAARATTMAKAEEILAGIDGLLA